MKLIKKTPEYWIISAPQLLGRFVGLFFLMSGIIGTLYHIQPFKMHCQIKEPGTAKHCVVYNPVTNFFGIYKSIADVQRAKIISKTLKNKKSYSLRLYTSDGKIFITKSFNGDRETVKKAREVINHYISSSSKSMLVIPNYTSQGNMWLMIFFIPFSLVFLYISSDNTLILNKNNNRMTLEKKFLGLFRLYKIKSYKLDQIKKFAIEEHYSNKNGVGYQLVCYFKNDEDFSVNAVVMSDKLKLENIVKSLNSWLALKP